MIQLLRPLQEARNNTNLGKECPVVWSLLPAIGSTEVDVHHAPLILIDGRYLLTLRHIVQMAIE